MTLPLPGTVPEQATQRALDELAQVYPLTADKFAAGSVGTTALAANAATKLHTTTASTSSPTTTSTVDPPTAIMPEMTITADFGGNPIIVWFTGTFSHSVGEDLVRVLIAEGGTGVANAQRTIRASTTANDTFSGGIVHAYTPTAGSKTIDLRWSTSSGTATATTTRRQLVILELRR